MDPTAETLHKCGECDPVFDRVVVSHIISGPTRILWTLMDTFTDPGPLEFQLQVGTTNNNDADDWEDVGLPVLDQYYAIDDEQRVWGKTNFTHYRVQLTTPAGVYLSAPEHGMGVLDRRSWRLARDMVRSKRQIMRVGDAGQRGFLLKRRWTGENCPACLDYQTKEIRNPQCTTCYGTGKRCGYFYPMSCVWAELSPRVKRTELDGGQSRGTINDVVVQASMLMVDLLDEEDIWVSEKTDDRYFVHRVSHVAEMRGVPIVANVELRLIPFTHIAYAIPVPDQLQHNLEED